MAIKQIVVSDVDPNVAWANDWRKKNKALAKKNPKIANLLGELHAIDPDSFLGLHTVKADPDINRICVRGYMMPTMGRIFKKGERNQCHRNTAMLYVEKKIKQIVVGYALSDDGLWRSHTWGLNGNKVVETTVKFKAYFGAPLTAYEADDFIQSLIGD